MYLQVLFLITQRRSQTMHNVDDIDRGCSRIICDHKLSELLDSFKGYVHIKTHKITRFR